ncbi:site-specific DNA-methyltransferase [Occultella glacieicola]|uniref:Site-specific DNA-methyltransferase n=2 Tax=Occultella glacieicola TaxID=2518684 RepID=A0ABY2E1H1_9MICO|nr:site-specific DNA-methyltransferase [Occultella glacieicola]
MLHERAEAGVKLSFPGKALARRISRKVRPHVQRTVAKYSAGSEAEQARNLLIEGDNLQALVTLYRERGHVDLILTDPPYNTGNDFRYNDKWDHDPNDAGIGDIVSADDRAKHTKWMKFMFPRLRLMKQMLKPSGVLAICIDHRELFHLGQMLDEIFGEQNRLAIINWQKITSPKNHDQGVSTATEYVLVYAKNDEAVSTGRIRRSDKTAAGYVNPDSDPRGAWAPSDSTLMGASTHPGQVYGIQNPFTGRLHYPQEGRCWRNERRKMKAAVEEWGVTYEDRDLDDGLRPALLIKGARNPLTEDYASDAVVAAAQEKALAVRSQDWPRYFWRNDQRRRPGHGELRYKTYLEEVAGGVVPTTFWASTEETQELELGSISWPHKESGTSEIGVRELNAVVGRGHGFDTVKPMKLIQKIVQLWCPPDGTVVDPFAGSGTTGHAVLALNQTEGARRRFILIEQGRPEKGDSYARSLTADRLARVISGDWADGKGSPLPGGFEFRQLTKRVDAQALLQMEREEMVDTVVSSYFDSSRRRGPNLERCADRSYSYLVAKNADDEGFYLVWDGPDQNTDFTEDVWEACVQEGEQANLKPKYHVYARFNLFPTTGVHFYQIPDRILADFGLDVRTDSYAEDDEEDQE